MDLHGRPVLGLGIQPRTLTREDARGRFLSVLEGPDEAAADHAEPVVLVLDEFQEIESIEDGGGALLRGATQETPHLTYVFAGSTLSLVERLTSARGPFHNIPRREIVPIDPEELGAWIEDRMPAYQKAVLRAIAAGVRELHGRSGREGLDLPASSAITKPVGILRANGNLTHLDSASVVDPFFGGWILRTTLPAAQRRGAPEVP